MEPGARPLAGRHVLLGVSGGIAAYKAASLARALLKAGATVQAVLTPAGATFVGPATFEGITGLPAPVDAFADAHRVPHVRLAREADVAVVAPATADVLAKFAHGLADDLLTNVFLCLRCPVVLAPAMHSEMWEHPATQRNMALLRGRGAFVVGPEDGALAGGDQGPGRLAGEDELVSAVVSAVHGQDGPLAGRRAVVTAGGTRERIDPVRFIGNRSSGKMGYALAAELARRGAEVDLVSAPTSLEQPVGVRRHDVETALEMREAVLALADEADLVVKAAAVADFRPSTYHKQKLKKEEDEFAEVVLTRNPDILAELGAREAGGPLLVGFAAETDLEEERGLDKLRRKGLDLIVVNRVDMADSGFGVDTNRALLLDSSGGRTEVPLTTKAMLASMICDQVERILDAAGDRGAEG